MTTARTATIQHRTSLPQRRAGLWATVKATATALIGRRGARLPIDRLDDHMLRDVGIDLPAAPTDPRDLILRL
jgi:uncharacterized protein YjiS (DUF1127 family)